MENSEKISFIRSKETINGEEIDTLSPSRSMTEEEIKRSDKRLAKMIDRILARENPFNSLSDITKL